MLKLPDLADAAASRAGSDGSASSGGKAKTPRKTSSHFSYVHERFRSAPLVGSLLHMHRKGASCFSVTDVIGSCLGITGHYQHLTDSGMPMGRSCQVRSARRMHCFHATQIELCKIPFPYHISHSCGSSRLQNRGMAGSRRHVGSWGICVALMQLAAASFLCLGTNDGCQPASGSKFTAYPYRISESQDSGCDLPGLLGQWWGVWADGDTVVHTEKLRLTRRILFSAKSLPKV